MNVMTKTSKKLYTIFFIVILMITAVIIIDISFESSFEPVKTAYEKEDFSPSIPTESGVFRRDEFALEYDNIIEDDNIYRTLETYYSNRAYPGAPPYIPHQVLEKQGIGGNACLQCHENGGFVAKFNAYAPVTPHPELISCKQCHVENTTKTTFQLSNWFKISPPPLHQKALVSSPPVIPHSLQLRENCLACHAGPAAPREIKVSHPTRVNCRQCHVPAVEKVKTEIPDLSSPDTSQQFFRKLK